MGDIIKVTEAGTLNLPVEMRRLVGLEHGGAVSIRVEDGEVRIRAVRDVMADLQDRAQKVFAGSDESVERFLSDRRRQARDEV